MRSYSAGEVLRLKLGERHRLIGLQTWGVSDAFEHRRGSVRRARVYPRPICSYEMSSGWRVGFMLMPLAVTERPMDDQAPTGLRTGGS